MIKVGPHVGRSLERSWKPVKTYCQLPGFSIIVNVCEYARSVHSSIVNALVTTLCLEL
jgi:hypothetical protein